MPDDSTTDPSPLEGGQSLTIARSGGELLIVEDDRLLLSAPTVSDLIKAVTGLETGNPLEIDRDASLMLLLPVEERALILDALTPSADFEGWMIDNGIEDVVPSSEPFFDGGNQVDGQPWGWCMTYDPQGYLFAPLYDPKDIAGAGGWFTQSMTGAVISTGVRCWGTSVLSWYVNDTDRSTYEMRHNVQNWDDLLTEVFGGVFDESICPACEESDFSGWDVSADASPIFADSVVGRALKCIWYPCETHASTSVVLEAADRTWSWRGDAWALQSPD